MDFFSRQEQSRKTTRFLVVAFALAFLAVVVATTAVLGAILRFYGDGNGPVVAAETWGQWAGQNVALLGTIAAGTLVLIGLASAFRTASLSSGGGQVARMMHATQITGDGSGDGGDLLRKRLVDVVEEMAIASGLPMPEVYVLEHEPAINAFASGLAPGNAAITVTRGALERLNRAELQGVVAHEFSHILNGDMRINQRLIGLCFGILVLSLVGRWLLRAGAFGSWGGYARYGGRRGRNGSVNVALVLGLAVTVIGAVGLLASRLIKAAVSRQREALADASAVQFTRDTTGLAGALKKIGGFTSKISSVDSEEVAHMLFDHRSVTSLFATHPPLIERIHALDPSFDPEHLPQQPAVPPPPEEEPEEASAARLAAAAALAGQSASAVGGSTAGASALGGGAFDGSAAGMGAVGGSEPKAWSGPPGRETGSAARTIKVADAADAERLLGRTGALGSPAVGGALRSAVPASLHEAAHSKEASLLLVLALALSPGETVRRHQAAQLELKLGRARAARCEALYAELAKLDPKLRIPILELAMPAIKQRPAEQLDFLFDLLEQLIELETDKRLFDYVLLRMLHAYLADAPRPASRVAEGRRLTPREALPALLAAVAAFGHQQSENARAAYHAGLAAAAADDPHAREPDFANLPRLRDLDQLDAALARLTRLKPAGKRAALQAVLATIRYDRVLDVDEIELFRAIAATLGCPVPPFAELVT